MKRWAVRIVLALAALIAVMFIAMRVASDPVPAGEQGAAADALAHSIEAAVGMEAWRATGAVSWSFAGRHDHLWDRARSYTRVVWGETEVVYDLRSKAGCAWVAGEPQPRVSVPLLVADAHKKWVNDSFWLNPLGKFFDPGVQRRIVKVDGEDALLVTFTKNGLTPGDSYLWLVDDSGRPRAWRMWTKIPIGGLEASWEGWQTLPTGAQVSTRHNMIGVDLAMENVAGAATLPDLVKGGPDPFARCEPLKLAFAGSAP